MHDKCAISKSFCQKKITFNSKQFELEGSGVEEKTEKVFSGNEKTWNKFLEAAVVVAARFIVMAVGAKTKNPKVGKATATISMSIRGVKVLL